MCAFVACLLTKTMLLLISEIFFLIKKVFPMKVVKIKISNKDNLFY
jgi:hypothetical protein